MPNPALLVAGVSAGTGLVGAGMKASAANKAADAQSAAAMMGVEEQRRQFDAAQKLLAPFVSTGTDATKQMAALAGVSGPQAQASALQGIQNSPQLSTATRLGEEAILANASATGGLRGGNTQAALAQFAPQMFSNAIDQRYAQLGGLAGAGQASAAMQAQAGQSMGNNVTSLLAQQGAARAGGALASGQAWGNFAGGLGETAGDLLGQVQGGAIPAGQSLFSKWGW